MARLKRSVITERRTAFAGANLTQKERAELERRASATGRRLSEYIRASLLSDRSEMTRSPKISADVGRKLAVELARIGNNLNQLSHHANATGAMPDRIALNETLAQIVRATEALIAL